MNTIEKQIIFPLTIFRKWQAQKYVVVCEPCISEKQ